MRDILDFIVVIYEDTGTNVGQQDRALLAINCFRIFVNKIYENMITQGSNRVQTGFRLDAITLARVKSAAKLKKVSVNTYVNDVLKEATRDIESEEEKEASRKRTEEFLDQFCGAWSGDETPEEILAACKSHNSVWEVPML